MTEAETIKAAFDEFANAANVYEQAKAKLAAVLAPSSSPPPSVSEGKEDTRNQAGGSRE